MSEFRGFPPELFTFFEQSETGQHEDVANVYTVAATPADVEAAAVDL